MCRPCPSAGGGPSHLSQLPGPWAVPGRACPSSPCPCAHMASSLLVSLLFCFLYGHLSMDLGCTHCLCEPSLFSESPPGGTVGEQPSSGVLCPHLFGGWPGSLTQVHPLASEGSGHWAMSAMGPGLKPDLPPGMCYPLPSAVGLPTWKPRKAVCQCPGAAVANGHKPGSLKRFIPPSPGGQKSQVTLSQGTLPPEPLGRLPYSLSCWWPQAALVCGGVPPVSAAVSLWPSLLRLASVSCVFLF